MKLFIADDSRLVREGLKELLADLPHIKVVGEASTGREAAIGIRRLNPDAIILDIRMPDGNGPRGPGKTGKKFVRPPGHCSDQLHLPPLPKKNALETGADLFLDKSGEFEKVREMLEKYMESSKSGARTTGALDRYSDAG